MTRTKSIGRLAAAALLFAGAAHPQSAPPRAQVQGGVLQGVSGGGAAVFWNIPYAAPPVGPLRWRAPQPAAPWSGVRAADSAGPACIQTQGGSSYKGPQDEDCLSLNVYTPLHRRPGARAPVMVWIHGGGFIGGAGFRYDGTHFAEDGVVLVTLNYRLGRLGFFAHPALAATSPDGALADFGLMDQIAALKWVKANIAAFGGDPANVTIFGESAGGQSVNALLVSPAARDLFAKAISESGFGRFPPKALAAARTAADRYAETLGVKGDDAAAAQALRALPASAFTRPASLIDPGAPSPILDGVVLTRDPLEAFASGEQARVPLIVGGNSFEASEFAALVAAAPDAVVQRLDGDPAKVSADYGHGDKVRGAADFLTFGQVIEPDRAFALADAAAGVPAFVYYFSYVPAPIRSQTLGAWHGAEVPYVFGSLPDKTSERPKSPLMPTSLPAADDEGRAISTAMRAYWVAFARTGRPAAPGLPAWPAESAAHDVLIEFGDDGVKLRADFEKARLDALAAAAKAATLRSSPDRR